MEETKGNIEQNEEIIEHLTSIMTPEPGDVIATGTPAGVGHGKHPPEYLHPGDIMVVEIEGLGQLKTPIIQRRKSACSMTT